MEINVKNFLLLEVLVNEILQPQTQIIFTFQWEYYFYLQLFLQHFMAVKSKILFEIIFPLFSLTFDNFNFNKNQQIAVVSG